MSNTAVKRTRNANGQGSFQKLRDGRTRMRKQHGYLDNGKPRVFTVTGKSRSDCINKMAKKEAEFENGLITCNSILKMTLEELCSKHLKYDIEHSARLKPTSADRREVTIRNQIIGSSIGTKQLSAISDIDISEYINTLLAAKKLSVSSIKKVFYVINSAYKWAVKHKYLLENPCDVIKEDLMADFKILEDRQWGINNRMIKTLTEVQIELLVRIGGILNANNQQIKYPACIYALFLLYTGMRIGELCALKWKDVIRKDNRVIINIWKTVHVSADRNDNKWKPLVNSTKNSKVRIIELNEDAIKYLDFIEAMNSDHGDEDFVALSRYNKPTEPTKLIKRINTVYRNAGLPDEITGAHILRRTFATQRYKDGKSVEEIAAYIGDLSSTVEKHYINKNETLSLDEGGNINYLKKLN